MGCKFDSSKTLIRKLSRFLSYFWGCYPSPGMKKNGIKKPKFASSRTIVIRDISKGFEGNIKLELINKEKHIFSVESDEDSPMKLKFVDFLQSRKTTE